MLMNVHNENHVNVHADVDARAGSGSEASKNSLSFSCIICSKCKSEQDGLIIGQHFICQSCEEDIVRTDVTDRKYVAYIHKMKKLAVVINEQ